MVAPHAHPESVPVNQLVHETKRVLRLVEAGQRVEITRNGKLVAILIPPDPNEVQLDELADGGLVPTDWREQQAALKQMLRSSLPVRGQRPGKVVGSAAILADRAESAER